MVFEKKKRYEQKLQDDDISNKETKSRSLEHYVCVCAHAWVCLPLLNFRVFFFHFIYPFGIVSYKQTNV